MMKIKKIGEHMTPDNNFSRYTGPFEGVGYVWAHLAVLIGIHALIYACLRVLDYSETFSALTVAALNATNILISTVRFPKFEDASQRLRLGLDLLWFSIATLVSLSILAVLAIEPAFAIGIFSIGLATTIIYFLITPKTAPLRWSGAGGFIVVILTGIFLVVGVQSSITVPSSIMVPISTPISTPTSMPISTPTSTPTSTPISTPISTPTSTPILTTILSSTPNLILEPGFETLSWRQEDGGWRTDYWTAYGIANATGVFWESYFYPEETKENVYAGQISSRIEAPGRDETAYLHQIIMQPLTPGALVQLGFFYKTQGDVIFRVKLIKVVGGKEIGLSCIVDDNDQELSEFVHTFAPPFQDGEDNEISLQFEATGTGYILLDEVSLREVRGEESSRSANLEYCFW